MQLSTKRRMSWLKRTPGWYFQVILLLCLLISTPVLANATWQVQHSCYPMINWSGELPEKCKKPNTWIFDKIWQWTKSKN